MLFYLFARFNESFKIELKNGQNYRACTVYNILEIDSKQNYRSCQL